MDIASGTYRIGPDTGTLHVRTYRDGVGARLAHDLVLLAHRWDGTIEVGDDPAGASATLTVDPTSFEIVRATGGVKPISDRDRRTIQGNIAEILETDRYPELRFEATSVQGAGTEPTVTGEVTIKDTTRPVEVTVELVGSELAASATISHEEFGMQPYSAMLGAIKLRDDVDVEVRATLTGA